MPSAFNHEISINLDAEIDRLKQQYPIEDCLKVDLHCHDWNSDTPDELWGRLLKLPESWLATGELVRKLRGTGCDLITVTNHNNARSCWDLKKSRDDVLVGAEFTCYFETFDIHLHVLCYGFSREQELELKLLRQNVHDFLEYCASEGIVTVLPHPLYLYKDVDPRIYDWFLLMFQRFEVVNGQRDAWQNALTLSWVRSACPETMRTLAWEYGVDPTVYGVDPNAPKGITGGSDDHLGLFAGESGVYLYVPNLRERRQHEGVADLALEALRENRMIPFGSASQNQKLTISILDYICQIAIEIKDPGLLRLLLHRGTTLDKLACFGIGNLMLTINRNRGARYLFSLIHDALHGRKPNPVLVWMVPKRYRFALKMLDEIAASRQQSQQDFLDTVERCLYEAIRQFGEMISTELGSRLDQLKRLDIRALFEPSGNDAFEIPLAVLDWAQTIGSNSTPALKRSLKSAQIPLLINAALIGAQIIGTRSLFSRRPFLNDFAKSLGSSEHPTRVLYLTDTLLDKNGVSTSLSGKLSQFAEWDADVDFLICHDQASNRPHLQVVKPLMTFDAPGYEHQPIRVPDFMEITKIFYEGGYDRIVCSTEGPMALVALLLKYQFKVPAFFFMHTDWMDFVRHNTPLDRQQQDRVRRLMRGLYQQFDGVFALNREHRDWLTGSEIGLPEDRVFLTAHHAQPAMKETPTLLRSELFPGADDDTPILFIACRMSREKGVFDLPLIIKKIREDLPLTKLVLAGTGPDLEELKGLLPEEKFLGWVDKTQLASLYKSLDLFLFPSRFDTFGNVILEAFAYGMPVVAMRNKGPADIVQDEVSGLLVDTAEEMAAGAVRILKDRELRKFLSKGAVSRVQDFQPEPILSKFLEHIGVGRSPSPAEKVFPDIAAS